MDERVMEIRLRELEDLCARLGARLAALEAHVLVQRRIDPADEVCPPPPTVPFRVASSAQPNGARSPAADERS